MGNTSPKTKFEERTQPSGAGGTIPDYARFKKRKHVDDDDVEKELMEHAVVVGQFAQSLAGLFGSQSGENVFLSPSMLHAGLLNIAFASKGKTREAFEKVLMLEGKLDKRTLLQFNGNYEIHKQDEGTNLMWRPRNAIFVPKDLGVYQNFIDDSWRAFLSFVDAVNYKSPRGQSWLRSYQFRIGGYYLSRGCPKEISPESSIVLHSGMRFQLKFPVPFNNRKTQGGVMKKTVTKKDCMGIAQTGTCRALVAKVGEMTRMCVLQPSAEGEDALVALAREYSSPDALKALFAAAPYTEGQVVSLPRFAVLSSVPALDALKGAGLTAATESGAEYPFMSGKAAKLTEVRSILHIVLCEDGLQTPQGFKTNPLVRDSPPEPATKDVGPSRKVIAFWKKNAARNNEDVNAYVEARKTEWYAARGIAYGPAAEAAKAEAEAAEAAVNFTAKAPFVVVVARRKTGEPILVGVVRTVKDPAEDGKDKKGKELWRKGKEKEKKWMEKANKKNIILKVLEEQLRKLALQQIKEVTDPVIEAIFEVLEKPFDGVPNASSAFGDMKRVAIAAVDGAVAEALAPPDPEKIKIEDIDDNTWDEQVGRKRLPYPPGKLDKIKAAAMEAAIEEIKAIIKEKLFNLLEPLTDTALPMALKAMDPLITACARALKNEGAREHGWGWRPSDDIEDEMEGKLADLGWEANDIMARRWSFGTKLDMLLDLLIDWSVELAFEKAQGAIEARRKAKIQKREKKLAKHRARALAKEAAEEAAMFGGAAAAPAPAAAAEAAPAAAAPAAAEAAPAAAPPAEAAAPPADAVETVGSDHPAAAQPAVEPATAEAESAPKSAEPAQAEAEPVVETN